MFNSSVRQSSHIEAACVKTHMQPLSCFHQFFRDNKIGGTLNQNSVSVTKDNNKQKSNRINYQAIILSLAASVRPNDTIKCHYSARLTL